MIPRKSIQIIKKRLKDYPAVGLVGPRQSGKTTLARSLGGEYFDLEQESDRLRLDLQWDDLMQGGSLLILDEAQAWPAVFPRLRGAIDQNRRRRGRILLLGSVSPTLMVQVSESLTGRMAIVELTPFTFSELPAQIARKRLWFCGGYPDGGVLAPRHFPQWQRNYLTLLAQRDLPNWGLPTAPQLTERFFHMLAAVHGQTWNASRIGQSLGSAYHTVNKYLDYLAGVFLIRRLPPYHANIRKRFVKSPKIYWRDSGLLHALLQINHPRELFNQPWIGASWEGFVIEQILNTLQQLDFSFQAFYLGTSDQHEIDLVLELGRSLWAIEIKLTSAPGPDDMLRLNSTADLIRANKRILVSQINRSTAGRNQISCNLPWLLEYLEKMA